MANDIVFSAQLDLQVADAIKKLEGSLPRIGLGLEKEMERQTGSIFKNTMKGAVGAIQQTAGIGVSALSGLMNPQMTAQEMMAQLVPQATQKALQGIPYIGGAMSAAAGAATRHLYQEQNFVHSGAKQSAFGALEQMAAEGWDPSDEMIDSVYSAYRKQRKAMWGVRTRAKERIQSYEVGLGSEGYGIPEGAEVSDMSAAVKQGIMDVKDMIVDALSGLLESVKTVMPKWAGGEAGSVSDAVDAMMSKIEVFKNPTSKE